MLALLEIHNRDDAQIAFTKIEFPIDCTKLRINVFTLNNYYSSSPLFLMQRFDYQIIRYTNKKKTNATFFLFFQ